MNKKDFYNTLQTITKKLSQKKNKKNNTQVNKKSINDLHRCFEVKENLLSKLDLYQSNKNIKLNSSIWDITVSIWWQEISIIEEYKNFTKQDIAVSFAYISWEWIKNQDFRYSLKKDFQDYCQKNPEHEKDILDCYYAKSRDEISDHMIAIPSKTFVDSSSYTLAAISHELWHIFANHLWKHLIDYERNANAFSLRFIRYIEHKYNINTFVLENDLYKIALASYQLRYLLHKHDPKFLAQNEPRHKHQKHRYDELLQQTQKEFL